MFIFHYFYFILKKFIDTNNKRPSDSDNNKQIKTLGSWICNQNKNYKTKNLKQRLKQYNGDKKDEIIPLYVYETDDIDEVERCVKSYAKKYQYRRYKEVYKADINMLKDLINDCGEFNEKTNLKNKWKSNKQNGGNHYIAIFRD